MAGSWFGWWRRAAPSRQGVADAATDLPRDRRDLRSWLEQGHAERLLQRLDAGGGPAEAAERAYWRGAALKRLGRLDEALHWLDEALRLSPGEAEILETRGNTWMGCGLPASARADYEAALLFDEDRDDSRYNLGLALLQLRQPLPALAVLDALLARHPDDAQVHLQRGNALLDLRRFPEARAAYRRSLDLDPRQADGWHNLGVVGQELREPDTAAEAFAQSLRLDPGQPLLPGKLLHARMQACDWRDHDVLLAQVEAGLRDRRATIEPFAFQGVASDEALQAICAELAAQAHALAGSVALPARTRPSERPARLHVGYVCGELRQQATAFLTAQLFESHDRARFECIALDNGWDDGSPMRRRVEAAFDAIVPIAHLSDADAAQCIADSDLDLLIDLNGAFGAHRQGVLARRPAPVQVSYLGYPGTLGAPYLDYLIADGAVLPADHDLHYDETIVRLPHAYQPNDTTRVVPTAAPTRAEVGLPADRFVFCCFNQAFKITPRIFEIWMSVLSAVPDSVLWLLDTNPTARENLKAAAVARGIASDRLIFAPWAAHGDHLARQSCADLFLDTLPYNAHTTASDALWAGLPLVTRAGRGFAARVGASLLHAVGLPELVTADDAGYEALALALARDPARLAAIRARLAENRRSAPLFDTAGFTRAIEAAYETACARYLDGHAPADFTIG